MGAASSILRISNKRVVVGRLLDSHRIPLGLLGECKWPLAIVACFKSVAVEFRVLLRIVIWLCDHDRDLQLLVEVNSSCLRFLRIVQECEFTSSWLEHAR